jgi:hypothetical protein
VLAGVSACRELEVLVLPETELEPLFPPGTAFDRLTHLETCDHNRVYPAGAGTVGLWELVASGGLPALAKLSVRPQGSWLSLEEVRTRVAPALDAVAGTLTHLRLQKAGETNFSDSRSGEVDLGFELGVAVGKLRRLKDLALDLFGDGRAYHATVQGLASSGGDCPLPLLWRVGIFSVVRSNPDTVASLLLPSVRVFSSTTSPRAARPS